MQYGVFIKSFATSTLSTIILVGSCLGLTACGSSDSSGSSEPKNISFTSLPDRFSGISVNEGEQVRLSLNTMNPDNAKLRYTWRVGSSSDQINFTGQNTDTITFIAPEVTGASTINVNVEIELVGGTLFGSDESSTVVTVVDTDPLPPLPPRGINDISGIAFNQNLSEVPEISLAGLDEKLTWLVTDYSNGLIELPIVGQNEDFMLQNAQQRIAYSTQGVDDKYSITLCGQVAEDFSTRINERSLSTEVACLGQTITSTYYGDHNNFIVEHRCDDTIVSASNYQQLSTDHNTTLASLTFVYDDVELSTQADDTCIDINRVILTAERDGSSANFTQADIYTIYQEQPLIIQLGMDDLVSGLGFYSFNNAFEDESLVSIDVTSPTLNPNGSNKLNRASITVRTADSNGNLELEFDALIENADGELEEIEGDFLLDIDR